MTINIANAQCDTDLIKSKYDEFDRTKENKAKIDLFNENNYSFKIELTFLKRENYNNFMSPHIGVFLNTNINNKGYYVGKHTYIQFLFVDNSSIKLHGDDEQGIFYYSNIWTSTESNIRPDYVSKSDVLNSLKTKKIKAIRCYVYQEKYDFNISPNESDNILKIFNCIEN